MSFSERNEQQNHHNNERNTGEPGEELAELYTSITYTAGRVHGNRTKWWGKREKATRKESDHSLLQCAGCPIKTFSCADTNAL